MIIKQPKTVIDYMWEGWKSMEPIGTIIHNDYGRMDAYGYQDWLRRTRVPNPALGFAHDYIDRNTIGHFVRTNRAAYHAGDGRGTGNSQYIGIEVNQSRGPEFGDITQEQFIENENMALRQSAEYHHKYGWTPNRTTVRLHNQFSSTSCPHLSQAIHGHGTKVQDYFIAKVKKYMSLGETVQSMIEAENNGKSGGVKEERPVTPKPKTPQIKVDGYLGTETIKALQRYFGTPQDGIISKPSMVVRSLQRKIGARVDGYWGAETTRKLQVYLGTPVDGIISKPSMAIRELQRRLNNGTF